MLNKINKFEYIFSCLCFVNIFLYAMVSITFGIRVTVYNNQDFWVIGFNPIMMRY